MQRSGSISQAPSLDIASLDARQNGTLSLGQQSTIPTWVPDKEVSSCMRCDRSFSMMRKKHHCRQCGACICNSCSLSRIQLQFTTGSVRVCDHCVRELQKNPVALSKSSNSSQLPTIPTSSVSSTSQPISASVSGLERAQSFSTKTSSLQTSPSTPALQSPTHAQSSSTQSQSTTQLRQWVMEVEKEREMTLILQCASNGYSAIGDIYRNLSSPQRTILSVSNDGAGAQPSATLTSAVTSSSFETMGVGQDVPDWAYCAHPLSANSHIARIGRLKLKINKVDQLSLNNITTTHMSNINNPLYPTSLNAGEGYVRDATLSAVVSLGNTYHQTRPTDITIVSVNGGQPVPPQSSSSAKTVIRGAKGYSTISQNCLLDVCDVSEHVKIDLVINKTVTQKTIQSDGSTLRSENNIAIPIGHINIPLSSLKKNTLQSLTLNLQPYASTLSSRRGSVQQAVNKASKSNSNPSTISLEVELCCSDSGYLLSQYKSMSYPPTGTTPTLTATPITMATGGDELSMFNIIQYALLILNQTQPILHAVLLLGQLVTWSMPLLTTTVLLTLVFTHFFSLYYPISLTLVAFFAVLLKLLLSPFFNKNLNSFENDNPAPITENKTDDNKSPDNNTVVDFTDQKVILALDTSNQTTNQSLLNAALLHNLSSLSPDSSLSITNNNNAVNSANNGSNNVVTSQMKADYSFSELFLEFLNELLPLVSATCGPNNYISNDGNVKVVSAQPVLLNNSTLHTFYQSLYNVYTLVITPFVNFITWKTPLAVNILVVAMIIMGLVATLFLPSHLIYIGVGVIPFLYASPPSRLLRVWIANKQQ